MSSNEQIRKQAKADAEDVLKTFGIEDPPINPVDVAMALGLKVMSANLDSSVSGVLRKEPGSDPEIFISRTDSLNRRRFTIAHELGHYIERANSGDNSMTFVDLRNGKIDQHEFYANEFAGNLLMPERIVRRMHKDNRSPIEMAGKLGVSVQAMSVRLEKLGL